MDTCPFPPGAIVYGYLRDSGGMTQDRSVGQQLDVLRDYCEQHQLVLERVFTDAAQQGDSAEHRDALWEMMSEIERFPLIHDRRRREEAADSLRRGVIFWTLARLGRDRVQTQWLLDSIRMRGFSVTSLADPIMTGNEHIDPVLESIMAMKNELDLAVMSREIKRGMHAIVALRDTDPGFQAHNPDWEPTGRYLGIFPNRVIPRGFVAERVTVGTRRDGRKHTLQRLVPNPDEWDRALLAWRMRVEDRASYPEIHQATQLYKAQVSYSSYYAFFKNRLYTGVFVYGGEVYGSPPEDPYVEPLVPVEWYELEAQRRAARAGRRRKGGRAAISEVEPRSRGSGRLLSGLLYCQRCGSKMWAEVIPEGIRKSGTKRNAWPFYWCAGAQTNPRQCDAGRLSARWLEKIVLERFRHDILTPERLRRHLDIMLADLSKRHKALREEVAALEKVSASLKRQADNLAGALASRPASPTLLEHLDDVECRQRETHFQLQERRAELLHLTSFELSDEDLQLLIDRVLDLMATDQDENSRLIVSTFISRIDIEPGNPVKGKICYTFPSPDLTKQVQSQGLSAKRVKPSGVNPWPYWHTLFTRKRRYAPRED